MPRLSANGICMWLKICNVMGNMPCQAEDFHKTQRYVTSRCSVHNGLPIRFTIQETSSTQHGRSTMSTQKIQDIVKL